MTDIPDSNNVYGCITSLDGLAFVRDAVNKLEEVNEACISVSGYDGSESLILRSDLIDFESEPLENGQHLLNGAIAGTINEIISFVSKLSHTLSEAGIEHHFEIYNAEELVKEIPGSN
ncbi:hypothetical protein Pan153_00850 [Gimesia panareensis]|uniref:Uncharacterized protein n=1 Tax=Gimesia panareensis TaxID=2527978 RepID=A0A518FGL5_9PLAN|nr:hypothetical protein [Gimesia panareensis]QDV15471.1 hypothetical protein Pan153_00850 [Gimesia panareensis]